MEILLNEITPILPIELIDKIMEYTCSHKLRNGKLVRQIENDRYDSIKNIPQKMRIEHTPFYEVVFYQTIFNESYKKVIRKMCYFGRELVYYNNYKLQSLITPHGQDTNFIAWQLLDQKVFHYK